MRIDRQQMPGFASHPYVRKFHTHRLYSVSFIIVLILIILILPLNILFIDSAGRSSDALLNQSEYTLSSITSIYINELDARIDRATLYLTDIMENNPYYQTMLLQRGDEYYKISKYILAQELIENSQQRNGGDLYFVYAPELSDLLLVKPVSLTSSDLNPIADYIRENIAATHSAAWNLIELDGTSWLIHSSFRDNIYIGSLIRLETTREQIVKQLDYSSASVDFSSLPIPSRMDDDEYLAVTVASERAGLYTLTHIEKQEALRDLSIFQRYSLLIALIYLLVIPLLLLALGMLLLRPLRSIQYALNQLKEGKQDFRLPVENNPVFGAKEFREIVVSFNRMADSIQQLTIENYEQQLARQQVELDNLQLTIRPHFLQNTFGILFTLCQMGENEQLGHFILYLSSYFRYIYQGVHQLTPFSSELEIIHGYVEIAHVQHPNSFEIRYELPEYVGDVSVPPLLIHNFIENIMSHALRRGAYLHILLRLEKQDGQAIFTITDDGVGMSAETTATINRGEAVQDARRVHVGLSNSWQRLDKIYHGRAGMHVTSAPGKGSTFRIWMPLDPVAGSAESG